MISGIDLSLDRGGRPVLDGVSLDVTPGTLLAVVGASGAGKSSLVRVLAGDLLPRTGTVTLDGRSLAWHGPLGLARRRALLPQDVVPAAAMTALGVVLHGRVPHGDERMATGKDIARRMLATVGLEALEARRYPSLSSGERARVQLARLFAQLERPDAATPGYLFLDEPAATLDLGQQQRVLSLARDFARAGGGVLAVLHDLSLAARFADEVAVMQGGRVLAQGAPGRVLTPSLLDAAFECETLVFELDGRIASIVAT